MKMIDLTRGFSRMKKTLHKMALGLAIGLPLGWILSGYPSSPGLSSAHLWDSRIAASAANSPGAKPGYFGNEYK